MVKLQISRFKMRPPLYEIIGRTLFWILVFSAPFVVFFIKVGWIR